MTVKLDTLQAALERVLGDAIQSLLRDRGEITLTLKAEHYAAAMTLLRDHPALKFEQLVDLCGIDYLAWKDRPWDGLRYAVVSHL
ncbi:MAG TPA: NADH-quinone oxidoreductase subunit C, partial [Rubrivivax sp.]|nr:NADH-quinone oxidoreductase subunit C [Rubrivivax sp.]